MNNIPFESMDYSETLSVEGISDNKIELGTNTITMTSGGGAILEVNTTIEAVAGAVKLNASGLQAHSSGLFCANVRGVAHGLGAGVMHYNTGTNEITYSTN
jgi:hypothetical protein|tara:strand:- start:271 stop:573 length:303 start_codon:yes stop_codon:yes gene_type:complete